MSANIAEREGAFTMQSSPSSNRRSGVQRRSWRNALFGSVAMGLCLGFAAQMPAASQTMTEALALAYETNPVLEAQRARLRETDETMAQALSGWRPRVVVTGDIGKTTTDSEQFGGTNIGSTNTRTPSRATLQVTQPVYRGGRTIADTERAEANIQAQRGQLFSTEQQVLLEAATAYMNVIRDEAILELRINNVQRLERQLGATKDQFNVGEVTRTDVAQSDARLSQSRADRVAAEGALAASREQFAQVVGVQPARLTEPNIDFTTPTDREAVVADAAAYNPNVIAQRYTVEAFKAQTRLIKGELLPEVSLVGEVSRFENQQLRDSRTDEASIFANVRIPLYEAGSVSSRVRQSKESESRAYSALEDARRTAVSNGASSYENLLAARARIDALLDVIQAAEIALEGVQEEAKVGSRTILDILDAEQELLNGQVNLVVAQRDEVVRRLEVLSAVGRLTARDLELPVTIYDFETHYRETRGKWWGLGVANE
ncbi:MAG: TolC family outer membrane protein [Alphaproteobacteria bacterium]|nr:TolC family outer membrane protein [Alphaproteobacteria bacterium]MBU0797991.1 TolC family outer membrane protein [Alphaproteobacteria bacterium]MBU0887937.1 TolC family outer membrane protein [Alphaproteobacteria bacterium]MBU1814840.1 TolC family outer membrane protein [Alphaproteobacteria bacterium]MBU2090919.1 TolC family outer membrane protein [Alphaproteobacteria bacterium]